MILLSFLLLTLGEKLESFCAKVESIRAAQPNLLNRRLLAKFPPADIQVILLLYLIFFAHFIPL